MSAERSAHAAVTSVLQGFADRGVFRGFAGGPLTRGRAEYRFLWLHESTFRLALDTRAGTLTFCDLLPNVPYPSPMDRAFRAFLGERSSATLPEHRRIDPAKATVRCANRRGRLSVSLEVAPGEWAYGVKKSVSLVNEIFHGFLRGPYFHYMVENFGEAEE